MFFLILLGWPSDEKNHAAFVRDLREFSRAGGCVVDRVGAWRGRGWPWKQHVAGQPLTGGGRRSRAVRRGPAGWRRAPSPLDCTAFRFARGGGYPQWTCGSTRLIGRLRSPLKCTGIRVDLEIRAAGLIGCSCSPVESTAFRVASGGGYPHPGWRRVRSGAHPHRWNSQPCESAWRPDIHIGLAKRSIEESLSPLKSTAFRVASETGYQHRRWRSVRPRTHSHR
ncbi:hypothetical protein KY49_5156 [Burkholderia sp. MSHR3999]|nr:hypothetical protein KY49_5156 [Burkholderia sp. MSHR3999]